MGLKNISLFQIAFFVALAFGVLTVFYPTTVGLNLGYILIVGAILVTLGFAVFSLIQNPKGAVKTLIGIAVLAAILLIAYSLSSSEPLMDPIDGTLKASGSTVQWSGAAIYCGMIALGVGALTFIVSEVTSFFR